MTLLTGYVASFQIQTYLGACQEVMKKWAGSWSLATEKKDVGNVVDFVKLVRRSRGCAERKRRFSTEDFGLEYNSAERYRQGLDAKGLFEMSQAHQDVLLAATGGTALHTGKNDLWRMSTVQKQMTVKRRMMTDKTLWGTRGQV